MPIEDNLTDRTCVAIRIGPAGRTPVYASPGAAGCDLFAARPIVLRPGETSLLPLDIVIALEPGVEAQIRPRSGLSLRTGLRLANSPGTVDSDFRDEVCVLVENTFSPADLAGLILARPDILKDLADHYDRLTWAEYWQQGQPVMQESEYIRLCQKYPELAEQIIYLDQQGNPYGTLYFQAGDRIAQMVFSRCLQAEFVEHPDPATVGSNRGGGFGSTGI